MQHALSRRGAAVGVAVLLAGCAGTTSQQLRPTDDSGAVALRLGRQGHGHASRARTSPRPTIVADLYAGVLKKAGYTPEVKLVDTRDIYMKVFPKSIDVVPEYVGGILDFLNGTYNGANAKPVTLSDAAAVDHRRASPC